MVARFQKAAASRPLLLFQIVQKRPIILPSKRRPLRARSCCYLLSSKRRPLRARSCCYLLLPYKRRPLRGRSCCSQLLQNSRRRPLRGPSWDLWFPIFQKRLIILPSKRRPLREKGGGHSCCSDPNCPFFIYASPKKAAVPQIKCRRWPLRGRKAEKGTERFYFLVPRINRKERKTQSKDFLTYDSSPRKQVLKSLSFCIQNKA